MIKQILVFDCAGKTRCGLQKETAVHGFLLLKMKYKKLKILKNKAEVELLLTVDYHYKEAKDMIMKNGGPSKCYIKKAFLLKCKVR